MSNPSIPGAPTEQSQPVRNAPSMPSRFDPAMVRICIELFMRATLYAGAFGLIAGLATALLAGE